MLGRAGEEICTRRAVTAIRIVLENKRQITSSKRGLQRRYASVSDELLD
jgi:hypothetical protein